MNMGGGHQKVASHFIARSVHIHVCGLQLVDQVADDALRRIFVSWSSGETNVA
jgi:hypothetical protein